jgi:hypothetical protein
MIATRAKKAKRKAKGKANSGTPLGLVQENEGTKKGLMQKFETSIVSRKGCH